MSGDRRSLENRPYLGLESYRAEDAELFFGRDREAEQLLADTVAILQVEVADTADLIRRLAALDLVLLLEFVREDQVGHSLVVGVVETQVAVAVSFDGHAHALAGPVGLLISRNREHDFPATSRGGVDFGCW